MSVTINGTNGLTFNDGSSQQTAASGFGFKNRIINGSCLVQQRAAVTISGGYQYGAVDRFLAAGGGTPTAGSITSVATTATVSGQALAITGYSSTGTGTPPIVQQRIEQKNCYDLRSGAVTISALVYQDTGATLTYALGLVKFGSVDVYSGASLLGHATMSSSSVPSGVWTRIVGTYTFGANDCDNGIALGISVPAYNGSISSKNFYYGEIQLEKGSTATSFDYRPYGTELALCQRYYQKSFSQSQVPANNVEANRAVNAFGGRLRVADVTGMRSSQVNFVCAMRTQPTVVTYNSQAATGVAQIFLQNGTTQDTTGAGTITTSDVGFCLFQYTGVSIGAEGDLLQLIFHYTANAEL